MPSEMPCGVNGIHDSMSCNIQDAMSCAIRDAKWRECHPRCHVVWVPSKMSCHVSAIHDAMLQDCHPWCHVVRVSSMLPCCKTANHDAMWWECHPWCHVAKLPSVMSYLWECHPWCHVGRLSSMMPCGGGVIQYAILYTGKFCTLILNSTLILEFQEIFIQFF